MSLISLGHLVVMMVAVCSSAALKIYPPLQHYNDTTEFTSFICSNDDDSFVTADDVEWLNPNLALMTSSPDYRIDVYDDFVTFSPPIVSDAGSYWCRNRTNHSDMVDGKLIFKGGLELVAESNQMITVSIGEEVILNCTVSASPDPVYSWSFPDSCSSCPNTSNNSVLIFTADHITDTGEYTCVAENQYGNVSVTFNVSVTSMVALTDCGTPKRRTNGIVTFNSTVEGSIASYDCNEGCILNGPVQRVCMDTGQWSGNSPRCKIPAPSIITHPTNASAAAPFGAVLTCSAKGCGKLNIVWHRFTKPLPQKAYSIITKSESGYTNILTIPNMDIEDVGSYYCVVWARNKATRSKVANLFLSDLPLRPVVAVAPVVNLTLNDFNLTMNCVLLDNDHFHYVYTWIKKGDVLPPRAQGVNSSHLIIVNLRPEDSGDYQCTVSNSTGEMSSEFSTVKITVSLPVITNQPEDVNVTTGCNSASFLCTAHGFGLLKVVWKRMNYTLPITAIVTEHKGLNELSSTLTISEIVGYYSGQYYCIAENEAGQVTSQTVNLHVKEVRHPEMILPPDNVTVLPYQDGKLNCLASSSGVLVYDWSKQDGNLPQAAVKSYLHENFGSKATLVYNLAIPNVQVSDEGWYCCVATNEAGSTTACSWLEVNVLPNIIIQPVSATFKTGELNVIATSCKASTVVLTPVYYQWEIYHSLDNSWIRPQRAVNVTSPRLVFSVITKEDMGIYRCIATNDDGSVISVNATVLVYGPPKVAFINNHTISMEGDKVNLSCIINNDPYTNYSIHINWYKGDKLISPDGKHIVLRNEGSRQLTSTLVLDLVKPRDDEVYTCQAFNHPDLYSNELKTNLTVEYAPRVSIVNKSPYTISVGSFGVLYCRATGKPIPTVQWYKDGFPVNRIASHFQQALLIPNNTQHTTVYTCVGRNHAGGKKHLRSANITVIVRDFKPCHPLLEAPENGERNVIEIDGFVKHISFSCNSKYSLKGKSLATCNNGTWSSSTPTCKL